MCALLMLRYSGGLLYCDVICRHALYSIWGGGGGGITTVSIYKSFTEHQMVNIFIKCLFIVTSAKSELSPCGHRQSYQAFHKTC